MSGTITTENIAHCSRLIAPYLRRTPVVEIDAVDLGLRPNVLALKLEPPSALRLLQGARRFRTLINPQSPRDRRRRRLGRQSRSGRRLRGLKGERARENLRADSISSPAKVHRIREYGADLVIEGERYADALAASEASMQQTGAMPIHAYDQGGDNSWTRPRRLEIDEQAPTIEDHGCCTRWRWWSHRGYSSWYAGRIKVVGAEPSGAPTLAKALEAGHPVDVDVGGVAADSLGARRIGDRVFPIAERYVSSVALVTGDAIRKAQKALWQVLRIVAEPGGAAALAAIMSGAYRPAAGERVGVIISGGNTTEVKFDQ